MNIQIVGWNDDFNGIRKQIILDVMEIMQTFFKNEALYTKDLIICNIHSVKCPFVDENPCTHFDRSRICLTTTGLYWCQFVHQLSHELCHCSTSKAQLPQSIKWFDEFICCCSSFLVEKYISISTNTQYNYMFGINTPQAFNDYLEIEEDGHIYQIENVKEFAEEHVPKYEIDENLIKKHDVYVREFFNKIGANWQGLSFVGKIWKIDINNSISIKEYLSKLISICNSEEQEALRIISDIFGICY